MRQTMFVKASGDVCTSRAFLNFIRKEAGSYFIVIVVGGGTQISERLNEAGYTENHGWRFGALGRELTDFKARQIARDVLEENQAKLQDILAREVITATVTIPVLDIGSVLCHVNGDQMLLTTYLGYDRLVVVTTPERVLTKEEQFKQFPKIKVIGL